MKRLRHSALDPVAPNPQHLPVESGQHRAEHANQVQSELVKWEDTYTKYSDLVCLPRSQDVFRKIELDPCLDLRLPRPNATAGLVLQHGARIFEQLMEINKPMSFKFGITHDPSVRYHNKAFGYKYSKERLQKMVVIYAASNPHGPGFLEAALIQRYESFLVTFQHLSFWDFFWTLAYLVICDSFL